MLYLNTNTFISAGKKLKVTKKRIHKAYHFEVQSAMMDIAEWAAKSMKNIISSGKKRSNQSTLEDNINVKVLQGFGAGGVFHVGVGEIALLNNVAKYWAVLNSGYTRKGEKYIPYHGKSVPKGEFSDGDGRPMEGGGTGTWTKGGPYSFKAKKFITPINYIDITATKARMKFERAVARIAKGLAFNP